MTTTGAANDSELLRTLLAESARGNRGSFARLYDLTSSRIYGLALRVVVDRNYAEEVVQEAYLQFWQRAADYQPARGPVISWMMTIAHRRAVDRVRSEELQHRKVGEYGATNQPADAPAPLDIVVDNEATTELRTCLNRLTDLQRNSIEMSYFGGLTFPEVAEHTSTPLPTVKSRIRDGLRKLRDCLRGRDHA
ncbi:sigma-70 family RNA polymerase sigma factor [Gordonia sp. NPDC003424]